MESEKLEYLLNTAIEAAKEAGEAILKVYNADEVNYKIKSDHSPLTDADRAGHEKIVHLLQKTNLPVLSEEGQTIPFKTRSAWEYFWLIDPLDGTKEFLKKNGEFTVNIALIHKQQPILGVIFVPVKQDLYWGVKSIGAFKKGRDLNEVKLNITNSDSVHTIVASRSHLSTETQEYISAYPKANLISMGSSLKFMLVAEGKAQVYPRFAPTMEWDTAAAQAIIEAAGGNVLNYPEMTPMKYNRENMLNGWFICGNNFNK